MCLRRRQTGVHLLWDQAWLWCLWRSKSLRCRRVKLCRWVPLLLREESTLHSFRSTPRRSRCVCKFIYAQLPTYFLCLLLTYPKVVTSLVWFLHLSKRGIKYQVYVPLVEFNASGALWKVMYTCVIILVIMLNAFRVEFASLTCCTISVFWMLPRWRHSDNWTNNFALFFENMTSVSSCM